MPACLLADSLDAKISLKYFSQVVKISDTYMFGSVKENEPETKTCQMAEIWIWVVFGIV